MYVQKPAPAVQSISVGLPTWIQKNKKSLVTHSCPRFYNHKFKGWKSTSEIHPGLTFLLVTKMLAVFLLQFGSVSLLPKGCSFAAFFVFVSFWLIGL